LLLAVHKLTIPLFTCHHRVMLSASDHSSFKASRYLCW